MLNVFNNISKLHGIDVPDSSRRGLTPTDTLGRGEATREQILDTAIKLFRENGFDETTMREVASECKMALGLTYHYFSSKDALVTAYYERIQTEHRILAQKRLGTIKRLRDRLAMLLHTKLDILQDDRKLLGTLFRYTGNPEHPLSFLGKATAALRRDCTDLFAEALEPERLPKDLRQLLPVAFWALHMGILLYFLYDKSPNAARTHRLADQSVDLAVSSVKLAQLPLLRPARLRVVRLLRDAELIEAL